MRPPTRPPRSMSTPRFATVSEKALNNLLAASQGKARPHEDLLPFILTRSDRE